MKKKIIILIFVILLAGILGYFLFQKEKFQPIVKKSSEEELSPVLNFYNWSDYIDQTVIEDFEKEFGIKVNLQTYENEEEMLSAIQSDPSAYDLIVVSNRVIRDMIKMKLLAPINLNNIPNFKNIAKEFQNPPYDPENKYSIPYMWGTTGIAINKKYIKETEPSWSILWNPKYSKKIAMLDDMQEVIGAALFYLGYSGNSSNPEELEKAKELLLKQKKIIRGYEDVMTIINDLISEKLWAGHIYSGDAFFAAQKNENIEYIIPKEGAFLWVDNFAIPVAAQHKYTAEVFINFLLRPEISARNANYLWYANTNEAAREFTNPEILENPSLYPPKEIKDRLEWLEVFSSTEALSIYNQIWAELQR